jgi:hypothetical protein
VLSADLKAKYEQIRQTAVADLESLDREIEAELSKIKRRLLELQEDKKAVKQILDGASARLGVPSPVALKEINLSDLSRHVDTAGDTAPTVVRRPHTSPVGAGSSPRPGD